MREPTWKFCPPDPREDYGPLISSSPYSDLDILRAFPAYVPRQDLTRYLTRYEIFKEVLEVQGSVVECGVYRGGGLFWWAQLSSILEPFNHQRRVVGFDSFRGLEGVEAKDGGHHADGELAVDAQAEIERCARAMDANRPIGQIPKIEIVAGDARQTIPKYLAQNPHLLISLLVLDFDVYAPTRAALEIFGPRLVPGAIVAFDEVNIREWPGETQALLESGILSRTDGLRRFWWGSCMSYARVVR